MIKYSVYASERPGESVMEGVLTDKSLSLHEALDRVGEYVFREALAWDGGGNYYARVERVPDRLLDALPPGIPSIRRTDIERARQRLIERYRLEFK